MKRGLSWCASLNLFRQAARQLRHALLEFFNRLFKAFDVRFGVGEELVQKPAKLLGIAQTVRPRIFCLF
jgi:hypothetical protein